MSEVGIEKLGFEFPNLPYEGHFTEQGYNPLTFAGVSDCWTRELRIFNADSGPFVSGNFVTVSDILFDANRAPDKNGDRGHHGFTMGDDTLLRNFDFRVKPSLHCGDMGIFDVSTSRNTLWLCSS